MNVLRNTDLIKELHAALIIDFAKIVRSFIKKPNWDADQFLLLTKKFHLNKIYYVCYARKGSTSELMFHAEIVMKLILHLAKEIWLRPSPERDTPVKPISVKWQLGGFFLTHFLYKNQPFEKKIPIQMTSEDLVEYSQFLESLTVIPDPFGRFTYMEIVGMASNLHSSGCIEYVFSDLPFGIERWRKEYIRAVTAPQLKFLKLMKEYELKLDKKDPNLFSLTLITEDMEIDRRDQFDKFLRTKSLTLLEMKRLCKEYPLYKDLHLLRILARPKLYFLDHICSWMKRRTNKDKKVYHLDRIILYNQKKVFKRQKYGRKTPEWALIIKRSYKRRNASRQAAKERKYKEVLEMVNNRADIWRYLFSVYTGENEWTGPPEIITLD